MYEEIENLNTVFSFKIQPESGDSRKWLLLLGLLRCRSQMLQNTDIFHDRMFMRHCFLYGLLLTPCGWLFHDKGSLHRDVRL